MRKVLLTLLLLACTLALTACPSGTSNLDKANGDWVCDSAATIAMPSVQTGWNDTSIPEEILDTFTINID